VFLIVPVLKEVLGRKMKNKKVIVLVLAFAVFVLPLINTCYAQGAILQGTVTDATSSSPLSGATVTLMQGSTAIRTTTTDGIGYYNFGGGLFTGTYTVVASKAGYLHEDASLSLVEGYTTTQNFALNPAPAPNWQIDSYLGPGAPVAAQDTFADAQDVGVYSIGTTGLTPTMPYARMHVVNDVAAWADGMAIPADVAGSNNIITPGGSGGWFYTPTIWLGTATVPGAYDIVFDTNANGVYDAATDPVDSGDVGTAGFVVTFTNVVPEVPLGTIVASLVMAFGIAGFLGVPRLRKRLR